MRSLLLPAFYCLFLFFPLDSMAKAFEPLPVFRASELLAPEVQKSDQHEVEENVRNDGYMNHYLVNSQFGVFEAVSYPMLLRRIHEIYALAVLAEQTTTRVAVDTGKNVGTKIAGSTVDGAKKLTKTLSDPGKTKEMIYAVPGSVANLFRFTADAVETGVGYVTDGTDTTGAETGESGESKTVKMTNRAMQTAEDKALRYTGYSQASASWAKRLEIDPYTDNELLLAEIRRVATVEATVGFAGRFVPSPPSIPGVDDANKWLGKLEKASIYDDPQRIAELNNRFLRTLGLDEKDVKLFVDNPHFTPTSQTLFVEALQNLSKVRNSEQLLHVAAGVKSRAGAWYNVQAVQQLSDYHKQSGLKMIVPDLPLPAAITANKELFVPLPVDHLVWSEEVATIFNYLHQKVSKKHAVQEKEIRVAGTLSARCRKELEALGFSRIVDKVGFD